MKTVKKAEEKILKEVESGMYRDYYLIYNRKSTDEAENQKNSIKIQKAENTKYAFSNRLNIAPLTLEGLCVDGIISEKHSGFKEDDTLVFTKDGSVQYSVERPKFYRLASWLNSGYFKGAIFLCWDRASRNKGDDNIIRKLIKNGVDIRFVYATYDKSCYGALHMDIDGMFAEHHSRVTSEKVKLATWTLRNKGVCTYKAPVGYLNTGTMEHKPFDPVRAPMIQKMFELYATGDWSLADLAQYATEHGFTTAPMRPKRTKEEMLAEENDEVVHKEKVSKLITAGNVQKILVNKFYTGRILNGDGVWIPSVSHEALVSDELFEKVQKMLGKKKTSLYYTDKIVYLHRGLVRCADCGRLYTPYEAKGIQYYGTRCPTGCNNPKKNFNITFLEDKVGELISKLSFTDSELVELDTRAKTDVAVFESRRLAELEQYDRRKRKVREDLTYLRTNKLTLLKSGVYSPDAFMDEENKLNDELVALQNAEQTSDAAMHEVIKDLLKLSELLKYGYEIYKLATSEEKAELIHVVFSELYLSENTLTYKCRNGFEALQSRFIPSCGQGGTRTLNPYGTSS